MKLDFIQERDRDILDAYNRVLKDFGIEARYKSRREIFEKVSESKARQFYVSPEEATRVVSKLVNGKDIGIKNKDKVRMYRDIYSRYLSVKDIHPCITLKDAIFDIIYSEAPSFYIKPNSLKVLFHYIQKRCKGQR